MTPRKSPDSVSAAHAPGSDLPSGQCSETAFPGVSELNRTKARQRKLKLARQEEKKVREVKRGMRLIGDSSGSESTLTARARGSVLFLTVFVAVAFMFFGARSDQKIGYFDEATHLDAAYSWSNFDPVLHGEPLSSWTLNEWSCRGFYSSDFQLPECGEEIKSPSSYPAGGINYNSKHPPLYHLANGLFARIFDQLTPGNDFLLLARFANVFWLLGIFFLTLRAMKGVVEVSFQRTLSEQEHFRVTVGCSVFFCLLLSHPVVTNAFMYVSNDVAQIFGGAFALWFAVESLKRPLGHLHYLYAGLLLGFLKGFSLSSGAFLAFFLLFTFGRQEKNQGFFSKATWTRLFTIAIIPSVIIGVTAGWGSLVRARSPYGSEIPPLAPGRVSEVGIPWGTISERFIEVVFQLEISQTPYFWSGTLSSSLILLWQSATIGCLLVLIMYFSVRPDVDMLMLGRKLALSLIAASISFYLFISLYLSGFGIRKGELLYVVSRYMSGLLVPIVFGAGIVTSRVVKFEKHPMFWMGVAFLVGLIPIYEFVTT